MGSPYLPFLSRFSNHRSKLLPLGKSNHPILEDLHQHLGVGFFKGSLLHILEPLIIEDLIKVLSPILRLKHKIPFGMNATGDLLLIDQIGSCIQSFDFTNNSLTQLAISLPELLNEKLYQSNYHPFLNADLVFQLEKHCGPLTTSEIYKAKLPILLGGIKKTENYLKAPFFSFFGEMVPIILQWEKF